MTKAPGNFVDRNNIRLFEIKRELTLENEGGNFITKCGGNLSKDHLSIAQLKTLHAKTVAIKDISQETVNHNVKM